MFIFLFLVVFWFVVLRLCEFLLLYVIDVRVYEGLVLLLLLDFVVRFLIDDDLKDFLCLIL